MYYKTPQLGNVTSEGLQGSSVARGRYSAGQACPHRRLSATLDVHVDVPRGRLYFIYVISNRLQIVKTI